MTEELYRLERPPQPAAERKPRTRPGFERAQEILRVSQTAYYQEVVERLDRLHREALMRETDPAAALGEARALFVVLQALRDDLEWATREGMIDGGE